VSHRAASLQEVDAVFHALAHAARRNVVLILSHFGDELSSGYLARRFQHSWPTTTRHLGVLERAGVVSVRREGRSSHYRLNRELVQHVVGGWLDNLTPPSPDQQWTSSGPRSVRELKRQPARARRSNTQRGERTQP
jgi:DNA-binding transcriptional ArsR family regulator